MLTLVLATPRTGSNTFVDELDVPLWMPEDHPSYQASTEYYNFRKHPSGQITPLILKFHSKLRDYVTQNPDDHIAVKVLIHQVNSYILNDLIKMSTTIHHTVRLNYQDQLKSFVAASFQDIWLDRRYAYQKIDVDQDHVNRTHKEFVQGLGIQANIYYTHGGTLEVLENRTQTPYKFKPVFDKSLVWPDYDTAKLFGVS